MTSDEDGRPIDPLVRIGHVHLKVADLERSLRFYCGVLGFRMIGQVPLHPERPGATSSRTLSA